MAKSTTQGKCGLCGSAYTLAGMSRHLPACLRKNDAAPGASAGKKKATASSYLLSVRGRYATDYWLHLEIDASATLGHLDACLRRVWLECCGHLSMFHIGNIRYSDMPEPFEGDLDMDVALSEALRPKMAFHHEYDFGSTTHLALKVVAQREGPSRREPIRLLARNDPPPIACDECRKPAAQVCAQCLWNDAGWLCAACARKHECGEEMLLPVVNSPRVGVCAYTGE